MPDYLLLAKASGDGADSIVTFGSAGADQYASYIRQAKGQVLSHFVAGGRFDLVTLATFSDERGPIVFSLLAQAGGINVEPVRLFDPKEIEEATSFIPEIGQRREALTTFVAELGEDSEEDAQ